MFDQFLLISGLFPNLLYMVYDNRVFVSKFIFKFISLNFKMYKFMLKQWAPNTICKFLTLFEIVFPLTLFSHCVIHGEICVRKMDQ